MIELEKKWLLKKSIDSILIAKGFRKTDEKLLVQMYLPDNERIRWIVGENDNNDIFEKMTKEHIGNGQSLESEIELITQEEFEKLSNTKLSWIRKIRTTYLSLDNLKYEFDEIYVSGSVKLMILEIEFQESFQTMQEVDKLFQLPDYVQEHVILDVTGIDTFSNFKLASL